MAKTFQKQALAAYSPSDAWLSLVTTNLPEAATQTFVNGAPIYMVGGYVTVCGLAGTIVNTAIAGFSMEAGHNDVAAGTHSVQIVPNVPGMHFHATFLGAAAADNILAAADLFLNRDLGYVATLLGAASPGYYIQDAAAGAVLKIVSFESDQVVQNSSETKAVAGDTNARVRGVILAANSGWYI